jgi:hypothetical protein
MELKQATAFVMSLKGAALSCLFLMYAQRDERRNWTRNDLADLTGWSRERVATGLRRLAVHELVFQQNRSNWQLTDMGYQLVLEKPGVSLNDSQSQFLNDSVVVGLNTCINTYHGDHEPQPLPAGVSLNDSAESAEPIFRELVQQLVECGAAPDKAREAILQAWVGEVSNLDVELNILWWRAYCVSRNGIPYPGGLIAARVAEGIKKPKDFQLRDIPERHAELRQDIEDLQRQIEQSSDQAVTGWLHASPFDPKK